MGIKVEKNYITGDSRGFSDLDQAINHERSRVAEEKVESWIDSYAPKMSKTARSQLKKALLEGFNDLQTSMGDVFSINRGSVE